MKNGLLALLFIACGFLKTNDDAGQLAVALAETGVQLYAAEQNYKANLPSQKNYIKEICWLFEHNPLFYKMHEFHKNIDYSIAVFNNHIESLEKKIESKENGLKSSSMRIGGITAILSVLCTYTTYYFLSQRKNVLLNGSSTLLRNTNEEALNYMFGAVHFGIASLITTAIAGKKFYTVYRYQERILERLERDKKILALLEAEKKLLENNKMDASAANALNNLLTCITQAINGVIQGKNA